MEVGGRRRGEAVDVVVERETMKLKLSKLQLAKTWMTKRQRVVGVEAEARRRHLLPYERFTRLQKLR